MTLDIPDTTSRKLAAIAAAHGMDADKFVGKILREIVATKPKPSISDVARAAGVDKMIVSRLLRGIKCCSPETEKRVMTTAQKLGYKPSLLAAVLAAKPDRII